MKEASEFKPFERNDNIKENIKVLLTIHSLTQTDLANVFGKSQRIVSNWVTGNTTPSIYIIVEMCDYFGISLDAFVRTRLFVQKNFIAKNKNGLLIKANKYKLCNQ